MEWNKTEDQCKAEDIYLILLISKELEPIGKPFSEDIFAQRANLICTIDE